MEIGQGQSSVISEDSSTRDVISDLLISPFGIRNPTEQKAIVRMQQPRPKMQLMTRGRKFQQSWYTKKDWLRLVRRGNLCFAGRIWSVIVSRGDLLGRMLVMSTCTVS